MPAQCDMLDLARAAVDDVDVIQILRKSGVAAAEEVLASASLAYDDDCLVSGLVRPSHGSPDT